MTHPRRTLDRSWHRYLQLHLPLKSLASPSPRRRLAYSSSGRAVLWVGFLACESARVRAWPPIVARPRSHFTLPSCQLNCTTRATCRRPPSLFFFSSLIHTSSAHYPRPAHHHCNPPSYSPQPSHNGPAQLILPARAVLCPYAGPLIDHQRASTLEQPISRPSLTVSNDSSSYHPKPSVAMQA